MRIWGLVHFAATTRPDLATCARIRPGLLKNTNLRRRLGLRIPGKARIVDLQIRLFQQARPILESFGARKYAR
jgi:hypothetical protein